MNPASELVDIIGQLKHLMVANMEAGLDTPSISSSALDYLKRGITFSNPLEDLKRFIGDCTRCKLHIGRTRLVFGEGSCRARVLFVGEGPGREEDLEGRPFVGEAGRLLTRIIKAMGLTREEVYICNVVKCRPPNNRDPEREEIETCFPFLTQQINIIRPQVICALGRIAAQELIGRDFKITHDRGKWHSFMGIPVMPTYHPAYILRNPSRERQLKGHVWEDVQKIMTSLGLEVKKR